MTASGYGDGTHIILVLLLLLKESAFHSSDIQSAVPGLVKDIWVTPYQKALFPNLLSFPPCKNPVVGTSLTSRYLQAFYTMPEQTKLPRSEPKAIRPDTPVHKPATCWATHLQNLYIKTPLKKNCYRQEQLIPGVNTYPDISIPFLTFSSIRNTYKIFKRHA